ncbi:MAG: hypothetical protein J6B01_04480 [Ruminococcus sp.]|nr:hypothetical protein [Ruminococcus sp.]
MELTFAPRGILQINDARIIYKNFRGEAGPYNKAGDRDFTLVIPNMEIAEQLQNDKNRDGVGWNVRIKAPRTPEEEPFITLKVKVKFNDRGPRVFLESNGVKRKLTEDTVEMLDFIDIASVDLDIRPYDSERNGEFYRTAYLDAIWVTQNVDRFSARFAEEESPEED